MSTALWRQSLKVTYPCTTRTISYSVLYQIDPKGGVKEEVKALGVGSQMDKLLHSEDARRRGQESEGE